MWQEEFIMEINVPEDKIWQLWTDVENWEKWEESVEYANINGNFENGTTGTLKSVNGPKSTFYLKDVVVNKSFTSRSKLPLCTMDFVHELVKDGNSLQIKHCIKIHGLLTFVFKNIIGKNAAKGLPAAVKKLVDLCNEYNY
jgi:hypothetical protein